MTEIVAVVSALVLLGCAAALRPQRRRTPPHLMLGLPAKAPSNPSARVDVDGLISFTEHLTRELRSGLSLHTALLSSHERHQHLFFGAATLLNRGADMAAALNPTNVQSRDERFVAACLQLGIDAGGSLVDIAEHAGAVLRERRAFALERKAQAAQAMLSAKVLTALPLLFAAWGALADERTRQAYVSHRITAISAVVGVGLNVAGWCWMKALVHGPGDD